MKIEAHTMLKWYAILLTGLLTITVFSSYSKKELPNNQNKENLAEGSLPQIIKSIDLDKKYEFATEVLPIENFDVKERLERELLVNSYWHSSTVLNIKAAHRYFPVIEKIPARK